MNTTVQIPQEELALFRACTCWNVRKAARLVTQQYDGVLHSTGLRATQLSILAGLALRGPITVSTLAEALVMDQTTLTRNLKPLEKRGLVQRVPGTDRRTRSVSLTPKGVTAITNAFPFWKRAQANVVRAFGETRFQRFLGDLRMFHQTVGPHTNRGRGGA
jgi:DNA-binding MarR family transcriptional regulator